jgi:acetyltransferase-like isoleucine patch superfamily enzyme
MNNLLRRYQRWLRRCGEVRRARAFRRAHIGPDSYVDPTVQVLGWQQVRIGHHTIVGADTWINVNHRERPDPAVVIGNNCFIARRNFLSAGTLIRVGDYCLTGPDCHFLGTDHDYSSPFKPYATTGTVEAGAIEIGANCWLGSSVIVLKNVRVGFGCVIGAGAVLTRDVPPLSVVVGSPARVVQRFDLQSNTWVKVDLYPVNGDTLLPTEEEYVAGLRAKFPAIKGARAASGKAFGDI